MEIKYWRAACALAVVAAALSAQMEPEPRWWRGNLHTHTLWSDGDDFPDMVAAWYRDAGYHFLALSDHGVLSNGERWMTAGAVNRRAGVDAVARYRRRFGDAWVERRGDEVRVKPLDELRPLVEERGRFLMIPAEELSSAAGDGRTLHMNATNIVEQLLFQTGATVRDSMTRNLQLVEESARRTGRETMVHVNHPNYKWGITAEDLAAVVNERFFEVWNGVDGDNDPGDAERPSTDVIWDVANTLRILKYKAAPLYGLATDDSHNYHGNKTHSPPGRAWVMVRARHLTPESIVRAIKKGDFYATTGVELADVSFADKTLRLQIAARPGETYVTRFIGTRKGVRLQPKPRGDGSEETTLDYGPAVGEVFAEVRGAAPSYQLRGDELYVRAVVESSAAPAVPTDEYRFQRAWTQPVGW